MSRTSTLALTVVLVVLCCLESAESFRPYLSADWSNAVLLRAYRPYADQAYALGPKRVTRQDPDSLYYNPTPCRWKLCANLFSAS